MNFDGYHIICLDPTIAVCIGQEQPTSNGFAPPLPSSQRLDATIEHLSWYCGSDGCHRSGLKDVARRYEEQSSDGVVRLVAVNTPLEEADRIAAGARGFLGNRSIYVRDRSYSASRVKPRYDAVYTARLVEFKRIHLASAIPRLRLLAGGYGDNGVWSVLDAVSRNADISMVPMPAEEVAWEIARAACGLALSKEEGAMRASTEYLLCGRPVVTTPSLGGRDMLYDGTNSICVEPDEMAVAAAVRQFREEPPNPFEIRARTVAILSAWRYDYCRKLSQIRRDLGGSGIDPEFFYHDLFLDPAGAQARYIKTISHRQPVYGPESFSGRECEFRVNGTIKMDVTAEAMQISAGGKIRVRLNPIAGDIARALTAAGRVSAVLDQFETHFGPHPQMAEQVRDTIGSLLELGVFDVH